MKKKLALAAIGFGAAYLMRNKDARDKLSKQFDEFANTPMRGDKNKETDYSAHSKSVVDS